VDRGRGIDAAAAMGPAAMPLTPAVEALLHHPAQCPAAAHALLRIDPRSHGGVPLATLADRLAAAADPAGAQQRAVTVLGEIGLARLPPEIVDRLRSLAGQDQRIIRYGSLGNMIGNDERLRAAIRQLLKPPP
jgi:hypothetical protein